MSIKKDNVNVTAVIYNNQDVNKVILNNNCVWCRPFTYTQGTLPTGVESLTCTRSSTDEPSASTGEISNGSTIYYYDKLYWDATASAGYRITAVRGSGSPVTVSGAITGTTASGVTSARISGTISQGTLPTGVASITCYRKGYNENSFSEYTGSTIYYGDQFYWTATAATEYNSPSLTYNNSSKVYTWTGSQGGSINSVSASGLSAGTRRSFTISFGTTANKSLYGSWSSSSQTAYYGDKITVSGTTVTCYTWDNTSITRWTVTVSAYSNTAEYTYSAVTIAESNIASVTATATFTAYNTRTLNSYTVTFSTTSGRYGSWGTTSISNVPYGTTITRNGNTVTVGNAGSSTFASAPTTVQYNYASPTFSVPGSVTGATTVTGGCERSDRLYTIQWIGENGSTVLETDSNVKYGAVLTYNGSTPSKPSTAQYSYAFSTWKLGSTSGSTVTSGSTTNAGSTSSTTINIYSTFTSTVRSYTITWKYLQTYSETWTTETQTYDYGATPSRTSPSTVTNTSNTFRKVFTSWDSLATVTGARTITANYKIQVNATFSGTRCYAKIEGVSVPAPNDWYDSGTKVTWIANPNCAFSSDGSTTTKIDIISTQKTNYTASADYVKVTKLTGTNCSTNFTTGWKSITDKITWTAGTAYAFDTSNTTSKSVAVAPGENTYTASYVKRYTLTISVTNGSYGTYSVSRTKSPYQGATTGALSNGATIFYGDVLTGTSSAKAVSYDGWNIDSVTAPTATTTGDATSGNLTITNKSSYQATLYYNTSNAVGGTSAGTVAANGSQFVSGLSFNTQYYISARVSRTRTKHTYATDGTQYSGTNGVTGNVTATFKFKDTTSADTGEIYSDVVAAKTAAQNKYTITWKYLRAYPKTWDQVTQTYNYGATPSRSLPGNIYNGNKRYTPLNWDDLSKVTGNRTITCNYKHQIYYSYSTANCDYSSGTNIGWYDGMSIRYSTTFTSFSGYAFDSSGTTTKTYSGTAAGDVIQASASYVKITCSSSLIGISNAYLSTSSNATSGNTSIWITSGTTVYGFAVLDTYLYPNSYKTNGWTLISGTANTPGAIYRVGSKPMTSATPTFTINLFNESEHSSFVFKRSGLSIGSWTIDTNSVDPADGYVQIRQAGTSIFADWSDSDGDTYTTRLGTFNCPTGYGVSFTLTDYTGSAVSWQSYIYEGGPYIITARAEEDTTTT